MMSTEILHLSQQAGFSGVPLKPPHSQKRYALLRMGQDPSLPTYNLLTMLYYYLLHEGV
jgi:hypothetical protein